MSNPTHSEPHLERGLPHRRVRDFGMQIENYKFAYEMANPTAYKECPARVCRRCREGPSYHGGHQRGDPQCQLFGCLATDPIGIQDFLRTKALDAARRDAMKDTAERMARGQALLDPETRQPAGGKSKSWLCERCVRGPSFHGAHNRNAPNRVLYGASGTSGPDVRDQVLAQDGRTPGARGHPSRDTDEDAKPTR